MCFLYCYKHTVNFGTGLKLRLHRNNHGIYNLKV